MSVRGVHRLLFVVVSFGTDIQGVAGGRGNAKVVVGLTLIEDS